MNIIWGLLILFIVILSAGSLFSHSKAMGAKAEESTELDGCYIGVFREGAPANMNFITKFASETGKKPAIIMWYSDWSLDFPKASCDKAWNYGAMPHIVWEPWYWGDMNTIKLDNINNGQYDNYIKKYAKDVKAWGKPIFLRIAHEFNIDGYPWGIINNGKNPEKYIKAYRRIVDIFNNEGATNVKWVWCFMNYSYPDEDWNDYEKAYPGDKYVDWVGIDGYNWGTTQSWSDWQSFKYLFRDQVRRSKKLHPTKPIMIAEFASAKKGGDKAAWIKELPGLLKSSMKDIDAIIWFDIRKEADWRITSSEQSLNAFKYIMKDEFFLSSGKDLSKLTAVGKKQVKKLGKAKKATKTISLDGNLSDFEDAAPLYINTKDNFKEGVAWWGPNDLSGKVYIKWTAENLYLGAKINDNHPFVNQKVRGDIWNGDGIEFVISIDPKDNPNRQEMSSTDFQIALSPGDGKLNKPAMWIFQKYGKPKKGQIFVKKTSYGRIMEVKIPWSDLGKYTPKAGDKIGFDIALDDADTAERKCQLIWNGDYGFYKDPSVWGVLEFVD